MNRQRLQRILPLFILVLGVTLFFAFDLQSWLQLQTLQEQHARLQAFYDQHALLTMAMYVSLYIVLVVFSLPGGTIMTVTGGFLFGGWLGGILAVVAATLGATGLFLLAKSVWGDWLLARVGSGSLQAFQQGFARNAFHYLLMLRLVPLFPFFLVNLAPAFLGVPLRVYMSATLLGIVPATFVFAFAGAGLQSLLNQQEGWSLAGVMTPEIMIALGGLALLSLIPLIYRWQKTENGQQNQHY